jgi:hypothetical protein
MITSPAKMAKHPDGGYQMKSVSDSMKAKKEFPPLRKYARE